MKPLSKVIRIDGSEIRGHLDEMVGGTVEETLNGLLEAEADEICKAQRYEHSPDRVDTRADLLTERGIVVSYETIRQWCNTFGPVYARTIKRCRGRLGDTWYLDEVYIVTVRGERRYLWRAVDQDGEVLDIPVQKRKDKRAAERFFKKLMKGQGRSAREIVTGKLPSYGAARKAIMSASMHCCDRYASNRAEVSHEHTRAQERQMRRFKSSGQGAAIFDYSQPGS